MAVHSVPVSYTHLAPWVKNTSRPNEISRGLQDRHIAIWQSHGNYFKNDKNEWGWQRPRLFCTTEDMFTQSFVLPYVIPMLENAGAIVYTPRERDTQKNEIIVDNDTPNASLYLEMGGKKINWANAPVRGFAQKKTIYKDGENPFTDGTLSLIHIYSAFGEEIGSFPDGKEGITTVSVNLTSL